MKDKGVSKLGTVWLKMGGFAEEVQSCWNGYNFYDTSNHILAGKLKPFYLILKLGTNMNLEVLE